MPDENTGLVVAESGLNEAQTDFINQNFRGAMGEHGTDASMADYQDLAGLAKSHINAQKMVGGDKLPMPQKDWGKEEWQDFNQKIGMPNEAKGYELQNYETANEADMEWFQELAHGKLNLSKKQANELWNDLNDRNKSSREGAQTKSKERLEEGFKGLREEWGTNYDKMLSATNKGLARMDENGRFRKFMKTSGLNKEPEMLRFANKVSQMFNEDRAPGNTGSPMPMNKEQAIGQYKKIYSDNMKGGSPDMNSALFNKRDPGHAAIVKRLEKLAVTAGVKGGI